MKTEKIEMLTCSTHELAEHLGLTDRRVRQLAGEGLFRPISKNKFIFDVCLRAYCQYVIERR